jgi:hypothetical protein
MWLTSLPPEYPNASPSFLYGIRYPLLHIQVSDNSWFGFLFGDIWNNWAEDFQMICHCGVCISWTKSPIALYRWLRFSFFSSSFISILPFLHFSTSSCKHVLHSSLSIFPAWLLTLGVLNDPKLETLMNWELVKMYMICRICWRVSSREEWRRLKTCNQHTQTVFDQI